MKTKSVKTIILLIISLVFAVIAIYFFSNECKKINIYNDLSENVKYIDDLNLEIYEFPNRDSAKTALEVTSEYFSESVIIPGLPTLVQGFLCEGEPVIEYIKNGTFDGIVKYRASIVNRNIDKSFSFHTYQLSEFLVEKGIVNLIKGRMIDFNNQSTDCIEILVTDEFGADINDEIYFTVSGLDKDYRQIVVKAKIVGIVEKGHFLYGHYNYCNKISFRETLHDYIFNREMIYTSDISYLYEYEREPNSLLDEEVPVFLLGMPKSTNITAIDDIINENNGTKVTSNATKIDVESLHYISEISYPTFISSIIAIIIILLIDITVIIRLLKRVEFSVINKH